MCVTIAVHIVVYVVLHLHVMHVVGACLDTTTRWVGCIAVLSMCDCFLSFYTATTHFQIKNNYITLKICEENKTINSFKFIWIFLH
jgi:hypothetical protein